MSKRRRTRRALINSVISLIICFSMLLGTTFAWFTDEVTSANNIIKAGNLDVELYYQVEGQTDWTLVDGNTNVFMKDALWEPGHTEVVKLKVVNEGSLALKSNLGVNIASEEGSTNVAGKQFNLSDYIMYGIIESNQDYTRDTAVAAVKDDAVALNTAYTSSTINLYPKDNADGNAFEKIVTMVVYMPTTVTNDANYDKAYDAPSINLGINLFATQLVAEEDSFGPDYDETAPWEEIEVTPENIQEYLDGQYGSLNNKNLVLTSGNYETLVLARPTKYAGSNTEYYCETHDFTSTDAETFKAHLADNQYHTTPRYTTTLENLMISAEDGVTVAGVFMSTGHIYGDVYDHVLDKDYDSGSAYYSTAYVKNIIFDGITFDANSDMNTSDADTVYDGITFKNCVFEGTGTTSDDGAAVRYYNEANNGNVKNLTVDNCTFKNWYQGVYTHHVNGITVKNSEFDTTGHNAIAMQGHAGSVAHKTVVIERNIFKNIGDRIIRFGDVADDTQITIIYNWATNSGDEDGEVIKATSLADGVELKVMYNNWGSGAKVNGFDDSETANVVGDVGSLKVAISGAEAGDTVILAGDVNCGSDQLSIAKAVSVDLNGNTLTTANAYGGITLDGGASIKNGIINHTKTVAAVKVLGPVGSIEDVDINITPIAGKVITGIQLVNNSVKTIELIKNVTITGANQGIEVKDCSPNGTLTPAIGAIENVKVDATDVGMIVNGYIGKIIDSEIRGTNIGINMLLKGQYKVSLDLENCTISGGNAGLWAHDEVGISNTNNCSLTLTYDDATVFNGGLDWDFEEECSSVVTLNAPN